MGNDGFSYGQVGLWYLWDIEVERLHRMESTGMRSGGTFLRLALLAMEPWPNHGAFSFSYASVFSCVTCASLCDFSSVNSAM